MAVTPSTPAALGAPAWGGFDPARVRGRGARDLWRSFITAVRLGWQTEGNWTDPILFFIYSIAKPLSSTLIFVVMVEIIGGAASRELKTFVVVGTALWAFVVSGIAGLAWSVLDDRERYRMLKYVVVSPSDFLTVLVGRGIARLAIGAMGAIITLVVGVLLLGVAFQPGQVQWLLLAVLMAGGLVSVLAIGLFLAAICMQTRQESWSYPEALAGALFLLTGAVFPLLVLPAPIQVVGWLLPITWWIEGVRVALFGEGVSGIGGAGSAFAELTGRLRPDTGEILIALLVTGALITLASIVGFRISLHRAKDRGLLDQTTGS
jgi:ABC-2 type transport system permease protein